jgi:hypothetical protein
MNRLQASLLGGLFIGVLSSLPVVNLLNVCCCLWVVSGGALTTYLLQSGRTTAVDNAEAAATGLLAGAVGALISGLASLFIFMLFGGDMSSRIRSFVEQLPQLPPEARDQLVTFEPGVGYVIFSSLLTVPIYAVFAMLGGLLALLFVRKPTAPAAQA